MKSVGIVLYFFILRITLYGFIGSQGKKRYFRVQKIKHIE